MLYDLCLAAAPAAAARSLHLLLLPRTKLSLLAAAHTVADR